MSLMRLFSHRLFSAKPSRNESRRLRVEMLEEREVPAVDLLGIADSDFASNKPLFVPITATLADGAVEYSVQSDNANVSAEIVTGGRTIKFTVSGKDGSNQDFTGSFTIRLFENSAPLATANLIELTKNGYYVNKEFHRVVTDFVIQGGSPNGDGQGGSNTISDVDDEFNAQYTFASRGIVAMANAGDDNNNAQFFITDPFTINANTNQEEPAPLDRRSEFLNFNHTIVGILTSGFDTYQKIMDTQRVLGNDAAISSPVTDVKITAAELLTEDTTNGLVKLTAINGFLGSANITVTGIQGGDTESKMFSVNSVTDQNNDRAFLGPIGAVATTKNTATNFTLTATELDAGETLTYVVGQITNTVISGKTVPVFTTINPAQGTATVDGAGKVTFTPAAGFTGTVTLTVGVRDTLDRINSNAGIADARNFDTQEVIVTVSEVPNTLPTISDIADQTTPQGTPSNAISFTIGDTETPAASLTVTVTSSNPSLVPAGNVVFGGSGANRTVTFTPVAGQSGTATLTVTVKDGGNLTASDSFLVTVPATPNNTAPTISNITNQTTTQNQPTGAISFTVGDAETAVGALTVSVTSSNPSLVPSNNVVFGGSGANRTITITPASGRAGTATITVTVRDGGNLSAVDTFDLAVTALPSTVTLTSTKTTTTVGRPVLLGVTITNPHGGSVEFFEGTTSLGTAAVVEGKAYLSHAFSTVATHTVTAKYNSTTSETFTSNNLDIVVAAGTAPVAITAEGSGLGTLATVTIRNADGTVRFTKNPYGTFSGLVRVKTADVNNDGQLDVIAVPGFGGGSHIVVYDGNTGELLYQNMIYGVDFRGGLTFDVGDAMGLGYAQLVVGAGLTGAPRVTLLDIAQNKVLLNFFAHSSDNRGGVAVVISDLRGGNVMNLITSSGNGLAPFVNVYNAFQNDGFQTPSKYGSFAAGSSSDTSGIRIGTGPILPDPTVPGSSYRKVLVNDIDDGDRPNTTTEYNPLAVFVDEV